MKNITHLYHRFKFCIQKVSFQAQSEEVAILEKFEVGGAEVSTKEHSKKKYNSTKFPRVSKQNFEILSKNEWFVYLNDWMKIEKWFLYIKEYEEKLNFFVNIF